MPNPAVAVQSHFYCDFPSDDVVLQLGDPASQ
jgi:hypothetical protein